MGGVGGMEEDPEEEVMVVGEQDGGSIDEKRRNTEESVEVDGHYCYGAKTGFGEMLRLRIL